MNSNQLIVKMVFDRWNSSVANCNNLLNALTDEQLQREIAPGKNRGVYLLGHLIAVHDDMIHLLNFGEKLFPDMHETFIKSPDTSTGQFPSIKEMRARWSKMNDALDQKIASMQTDDWFQKHTAVSAEDFSKEPHRNKLNIIITRTTHLSYHTGQLVLLK